MNQLVLLFVVGGAVWFIRRDTARRDGISAALWIPTIWVGILASRPLSLWLNWGGGESTLEGSPLDRLFYFGMIVAALVVLSRRQLPWSELTRRNWPILLFYAYLLVSVTWSPSPFSSFKRWFKDFGNLFIALVILTEVNPEQAFRAVFVRCAYVLLPLSIVFVRYFPDLGRYYGRSGRMEVVGVSTQKNSLGILVVICGLVLLWDWCGRSRSHVHKRVWVDRCFPLAFVLIGAYLLYLCDSKTSILCLLLGGGIIITSRLPILRARVGGVGILVIALAIGYFILDWLFPMKGAVLSMLGRSGTMTGRTDVWRELLSLGTDPLIGTGFCSFWDNQFYKSKLPYWVGCSAHNGYLETYIDGGYIGVFFLVIMLIVTGFRFNRFLAFGQDYGLVRFAILVAILLGSYAESHFGRLTPLWFMFLLVALEPLEEPQQIETQGSEDMASEAESAEFSERVA